MTNEELQAIKTRAEKATPGPWTADFRFVLSDGYGLIAGAERGMNEEEDAEFIAHARADVPALVDEIEQAYATWKAQQADISQQLDELKQMAVKLQAVHLYAEYTHKAWAKGSPVMTFDDWHRLVTQPPLPPSRA